MENQPPVQPTQYSSNPQVPLPNGTATLVLGIVSIVGCFCYGVIGLVCGIIALVLYNRDKKLYAENPEMYTPGSYSNLKSGRICAIVGLSMSAICMVVAIIYLAIYGMAILSNPNAFFHHVNNY